MARNSLGPPGKALLLLAFLLIVILVVVDLSSPDSFLISLWDSLLPGQTQGEHSRDTLLRQLRAKARR